MRWKQGRRSSNIEDRRGMSSGGRKVGGGLGMLVVALIALYFGKPELAQRLLSGGGGQSAQVQQPPDPAQDELAELVSVVLADTEDTWTEIFASQGRVYEKPTLVMFSQNVHSGCGPASADMGPFYCPADRKVYIDLMFYEALRRRHKAPGDFAQAYVVAHEVGHHIQKLLGYSDYVNSHRGKVSKVEQNQLSVRLELQADYLAGVWAHHAHKARNILERGDVEEALNAAAAIGDDRMQREATGRVIQESFTHGTSEQRVRWFRKGLETGDASKPALDHFFEAASL